MNTNPNKQSTISQRQAILELLLAGYAITPLQALEYFGTMKASTRVSELIKDGWPIQKQMITVDSGKRVMKYKL